MYLVLTNRLLNSRNVLEEKAFERTREGQTPQYKFYPKAWRNRIAMAMWSVWLSFTHGTYQHSLLALYVSFWPQRTLEEITKTRQSEVHEKYRAQIPKMFETRNDRCPVNIFRTYLAKRPTYLRVSGPFYFAVICDLSCGIWFKRSPMGIHAINNIMKTVISKFPLETSKHINHSVRKTQKCCKVRNHIYNWS